MDTVFGKLRIKRRNEADLPALDVGEPALALDTEDLWIGTDDGNKKVTFDLMSEPALHALAALTPVPGFVPYFNGTTSASTFPISSFGKDFVAEVTGDDALDLLAGDVPSGTGGLLRQSNPRIDDDIAPLSNGSADLGLAGNAFERLYLNAAGVINFANGGYLVTHATGLITFGGSVTITSTLAALNMHPDNLVISTSLEPVTSGAVNVGSGTFPFGSLFLKSTGTINFGNSNWVATHSSGILNVTTGDFRITSPGSNAASVVTVGGLQAIVLTNATGLPISSGVTGLGTGIATALAINAGAAGAVVVDGTNTTGVLPYDVSGRFGGTWKGAHKLTSTDPTGSGTGSRSTVIIKRNGVGSGTNGPDHTDYGMHLEVGQDNYLSTSVMGEMDGMYIIGTKGAKGDLGGILMDLQKVQDSIYGIVGLESVVSWLDSGGTVLEGCRAIVNGRIGGADLRTGTFGFLVEPADTGQAVTHGVLVLGASGSVTTAIQCSTSRFDIDTYFKVTPTLTTVSALSVFLGQIGFPGTMNPSLNGNTLDDYEEGTWTPIDASGAGLTFAFAEGYYIKVGRLVNFGCVFQYPATGSAANAAIGGLPFTSQNAESARGGCLTATNSGTATKIFINKNATTAHLYTNNLTNVTNAQMSGTISYATSAYPTA